MAQAEYYMPPKCVEEEIFQFFQDFQLIRQPLCAHIQFHCQHFALIKNIIFSGLEVIKSSVNLLFHLTHTSIYHQFEFSKSLATKLKRRANVKLKCANKSIRISLHFQLFTDKT